MKKTEMEGHSADYEGLMAQAQQAQRKGLYRKAVELALAAGQHIDGMMQYEQKYANREFLSIPAIELVLRLAPLLLDLSSLDKLQDLLRQCRQIERETSAGFSKKIDEARAQTWRNHRLWRHVEQNPECRQDELGNILGGDQGHWVEVTEAWESMGLLRRTLEGRAYRLTLSTRMGELVKAKCSSCGNVLEGTKAVFLEEIPCSICQSTVLFVILSSETFLGKRE